MRQNDRPTKSSVDGGSLVSFSSLGLGGMLAIFHLSLWKHIHELDPCSDGPCLQKYCSILVLVNEWNLLTLSDQPFTLEY